MKEVFSARIPHIYLLYGLAFFALGLALVLEMGRTVDSRFKRALRPLAFFGLVHGFHEWFEMFERIGEQTYDFVAPSWLEWARLVVLAVSFLALGYFGVQMLRLAQRLNVRDLWLGIGVLGVYALGVLELGAWLDWAVTDWLKAADAWTRYSLGVPGALLTAWGLLIQRRFFVNEGMADHVNSLTGAALAFALYGGVGQVTVSPSTLFPSTVINTDWFLDTLGIPIQLFRALMAMLIAVFVIRALRAFDVHRRWQLAAAQKEAQEAIARRDALRGELLRRSVAAQEEERGRIARELHDEIGQTLAGLAAGLQGIQRSLSNDPERARAQLRQLQEMTTRAIGELSNMVADLRPSLLDDMGLHAALGWYADQINRRSPTQVALSPASCPCRLPPEIETTFFRITQEALTNVIRHAEATQAEVELVCEPTLTRLRVRDDGIGFDPAKAWAGRGRSGWGLAGIQERVQLAGGQLHLQSAPGEGTTLIVEIPLSDGEETDDDDHQIDVGR